MGVSFEPDSVLGSAMDRNRIELDQKFTDLIDLISVFKKDLMKVASVAQTGRIARCGSTTSSVATVMPSERRLDTTVMHDNTSLTALTEATFITSPQEHQSMNGYPPESMYEHPTKTKIPAVLSDNSHSTILADKQLVINT